MKCYYYYIFPKQQKTRVKLNRALTIHFSLAIAERLNFLIVASIKMQSSYRVVKANKRRTRHKGYIQRKFAETRSILPLVLPGYSK